MGNIKIRTRCLQEQGRNDEDGVSFVSDGSTIIELAPTITCLTGQSFQISQPNSVAQTMPL